MKKFLATAAFGMLACSAASAAPCYDRQGERGFNQGRGCEAQQTAWNRGWDRREDQGRQPGPTTVAAPVPEGDAYAMALGGLVVVGVVAAVRRRRD